MRRESLGHSGLLGELGSCQLGGRVTQLRMGDRTGAGEMLLDPGRSEGSPEQSR